MRKYIFFTLLSFLTHSVQAKNPEIAFTYAEHSGRLGDHLWKYIKTKWLSYKYNYPLYHKPFKHSEEFVFHYKEKHFNDSIGKKFDQIIDLTNEKTIKYHIDKSTLFNIKLGGNIQATPKNTKFIAILKEMIAPIESISFPPILKDKISVALHVRKGGGFDKPLLSEQLYTLKRKFTFADKEWPLRFPPDQYYIDQIKWLSNYFDNAPIHIHIFTDDPHPKKILELYKKHINKTNLSFSCREEGNHHSKNVIDDLFAMMKFDCLIRPNSNLSKIAMFLSNHKIVISPKHGYWIENKLIINQIQIQKRERFYEEYN